MKTLTAVLVLGLLAIAYCEDCTSAIENFRKCRQEYREKQKASRPDPSKRQDDMKNCFTKSGCKAPTFDEKKQDGSGGGREAAQKCHKEIGKKAHDLVKACVEKKTGVKLPTPQNEDKDKEHHGGGGGRGGHGDIQEELKTSCSNDQQRNDTRKCLRGLMQDNKDDRQQEAEKRFNDNCANKRECFSKLSPACQSKFNETRSAACDCAKSELTPKKDEFQKQAETCRANAPNKGSGKGPHKEGGRGGENQSFVDRAIKRACDNEDRCDKPYEAKQHGGWKGGKGHGKGKGHN